MHGYGFYTYPDGVQYKGQFIEGLKEGYGVYIWTDDRQYNGWWFKGKQHGFGAYVGSNDELRLGIWEMGKRVAWLTDPEIKQVDSGQYNYKKVMKINIEDQPPFIGNSFKAPAGWQDNMEQINKKMGLLD